jgi:hypothetical protein
MESKATFKMAPVDTFTPETTSEEVVRLQSGVEPLEGAVVVGGHYSADCFRYEGQLQAGLPKKGHDFDVPYDFNARPVTKWTGEETRK